MDIEDGHGSSPLDTEGVALAAWVKNHPAPRPARLTQTAPPATNKITAPRRNHARSGRRPRGRSFWMTRWPSGPTMSGVADASPPAHTHRCHARPLLQANPSEVRTACEAKRRRRDVFARRRGRSASGTDLTANGQRLAQQTQRLRHQPEERPPAALFAGEDAGLVEHPEVMTHRRL